MVIEEHIYLGCLSKESRSQENKLQYCIYYSDEIRTLNPFKNCATHSPVHCRGLWCELHLSHFSRVSRPKLPLCFGCDISVEIRIVISSSFANVQCRPTPHTTSGSVAISNGCKTIKIKHKLSQTPTPFTPLHADICFSSIDPLVTIIYIGNVQWCASICDTLILIAAVECCLINKYFDNIYLMFL